jgi:tripartite-type tricarboxylate transporter receptor subunit TctC
MLHKSGRRGALRSGASAVALAAVATLSFWPLASVGQSAYPIKPIRIIVPFTAGSATDTLARIFAQQLSAQSGVSVVVDNRPGAGGTIGTALLAKAAPDGYTLGVTSTAHVVNPAVYPNLPFDPIKSFSGVSILAVLPSVLAVSPALGVHTVKEFVTAAKARPGEFNFGSAGVGSAAHVITEKFLHATGIQAQHIPFKGTPEMLTETIGGRIQFIWTPIVSSLGPLKEGKLVPLAVSTHARSALLPDVPTISEAGVPGGEAIFWIALIAPAQTPREVINKLNMVANSTMQSPDMNQRMASLGGEAMILSPEMLDAFMLSEYETLGAVMRTASKVGR